LKITDITAVKRKYITNNYDNKHIIILYVLRIIVLIILFWFRRVVVVLLVFVIHPKLGFFFVKHKYNKNKLVLVIIVTIVTRYYNACIINFYL
jgi:hypothetical protein